MWKSENNLWGLVFFFHHVGSENETQVENIIFCSKHLCLLSNVLLARKEAIGAANAEELRVEILAQSLSSMRKALALIFSTAKLNMWIWISETASQNLKQLPRKRLLSLLLLISEFIKQIQKLTPFKMKANTVTRCLDDESGGENARFYKQEGCACF